MNTSIGKYYYIKIRPYRTTTNVIDGVVITLEDITDLKSAEKMARLAVVLKDSNDAIILISSEGSILEWNFGAEKLYGYSENEALKMNFKELIASKSKTEQNKSFKELVNSTDSKIIKLKRIKKDGKELEVLTTIYSILDETSKSKLLALTEMERTQIEKIVQS